MTDPGNPYALYRYFDGGGRLLYIGISGDLAVREMAHVGRSRWMQLMARSVVEWYPTLNEVQDAERRAIESEHPLFNRQHNDTPEALERLRAYLDEIGRPDLFSSKKKAKATVKPSPLSGRPANKAFIRCGDFFLEVKRGSGVELRILSGGWKVTVPLDAGKAFELCDALQRHAWDAEWAQFGFPAGQYPWPVNMEETVLGARFREAGT